MPTYTCHSRSTALDATDREQLAARFTATHAAATAAPSSFVQVVFLDLPEDAHFIAGRPVDPRGIHVHGHIRAGRTPEAKHHLITGLHNDVHTVTGIPAEHIWVYVSEIPPAQMVEFGHVLPEPGQESAWIAALPPRLAARLRDLEAPRQ